MASGRVLPRSSPPCQIRAPIHTLPEWSHSTGRVFPVLVSSTASPPFIMTAWRRDIHRYPECAYQEHHTAGKVAALLRAFGVDEVVEGVGRTGVVGVLAQWGPCRSRNWPSRPYRSCHDGIMHACGHDGHTTMLLGTARYLAKTRTFRGTVVLIFQPVEEGAAGAQAMIDDSLLDRFPVETIYGVHNLPGLPVGTTAVSGGAVMAAADHFEVLFRGHGSHAATPHVTRDPLLAGIATAQASQIIVSRNTAPAETLLVSVIEFHAGDAFNVIPDSARCGGMVRYFDPSSRYPDPTTAGTDCNRSWRRPRRMG
ncbi:MAG: Catalyzes the cleavage of p-aminobenzoyl-glutamate to p-aminobenzoate and glutamate subunit A [Rhodospirillaceae bacterium]|nr:MAG: Catalyzes the cleavage of p-aminobenzoyl-glutamate to p-aminobenzoate and glutamate subunit A [Rhodospirillaceae bacterium]